MGERLAAAGASSEESKEGEPEAVGINPTKMNTTEVL